MTHQTLLAHSMAVAPVEAALRQLRLLATALVAMWVLVNADRDMWQAGDALPLALALVPIAVTVNLLSKRAERGDPAGRIFRLATLGCDATLILLLVAAMDDAYDEVIWAAIVVPVLEGALYYRLRGLVLTWLVLSAAYVGLVVWRSDPVLTSGPSLELLQTSIHRVAVVLLVAVPAGFLSSNLTAATAAHATARARANRRSAVLETVVGAARAMTSLEQEVDVVLASEAQRFGFIAVDLIERDTRSHAWRVLDGYRHSIQVSPDAAPGAAAWALRHGTVILDGSDDQQMLAAHGLSALVMTPLPLEDGTSTVLRAAVHPDGALLPEHVEALELLAGQAAVALRNRRLMSELTALHDRLDHQAHHDALTGLPNRERFHQRLADAHAAVVDGTAGLALLFLDLDGFKDVNDTHGHDVGDDLLVAVADRLRGCLRASDVAARLGGDEFTIVITGPDPATDANEVASRVGRAIGRPFRIGPHNINISTSIGCSLATTSASDEPPDPSELIRRADLAMYRAKREGAGGCCMYSPAIEGSQGAGTVVAADIRTALADDAFRLVYQPVVDVTSNRIIGAEALLRWDDPRRGVVPPSSFVPVAEETGLIHDLGWWVLDRAVADWSDLQSRHHGDAGTIAVNVSPHQLEVSGFCDRLMGVLATHRLAPAHLLLEITEGAMLSEPAAAAATALRGRGVAVAIDDFGTGHASMSYLQRVRLDVLKIDRSYLRYGTSPADRRAILRSVITLAHDLGMTVIAEGVETDAELRELIEFGCDAAQGFLMHEPISLPELDALVAQQRPNRPTRNTRVPATRQFGVSIAQA